jgi:hypothetical protein
MSWRTVGGERRACPPEYQEHINTLGGMNRFSEPNFLLVWGETHTQTFYGEAEGGKLGQHTMLQFGVPAWHLLEWKPPETFGTPDFWYRFTWDEAAQVHALGEYPWRGLYLPCTFNLYVKRIEGGGIAYDKHGQVVESPSRLIIDAMPLNYFILDLIIPNIFKSREMTHRAKVAAIEARMAAEKQARLQRGYDAYVDAAPAFGGKAGTHESNREAWMQRLAEKQAGMRLTGRQFAPGHVQKSGIRRK